MSNWPTDNEKTRLDSTQAELYAIGRRYARRKPAASWTSAFEYWARAERERLLLIEIAKKWKHPSELRVLEIGAGHGDNLWFFFRLGIPPGQVWANELLEDRLAVLRRRVPGINVLPGDASTLQIDGFDIVLQSTVLSSVLDANLRSDIARKMLRFAKPGGMCFSYDLGYNNPKNPDVRGLRRAELLRLFSDAHSVRVSRVTLLPPLARRVGDAYPFLNYLLRPLRTHLFAAIDV